MQFVGLGNSNLKVSCMGLGTHHFGAYLKKDESIRLLKQASESGVNFIDTAPMYGQGNSEGIIGQAVKGQRDKYVIATKVGLRPSRTPEGHFGVETVPLTAQTIRSSLEASLKALGTDYVDSLQLHYFDDKTPLEETFGTVEQLIREGKVRWAGCSNYDGQQLKTVAVFLHGRKSGWLVSAQAHYNLIERRAEKEIAPVSMQWNIPVVVNRALSRGILSGQYKFGAPLPSQSRGALSWRVRRWLDEPTLSLVEDLDALARRSGRSFPQMALQWLAAKPYVAVVLVGARDSRQLADCLKAFDRPVLETFEEVDEIIAQHELTEQVYQRPPELFEK